MTRSMRVVALLAAAAIAACGRGPSQAPVPVPPAVPQLGARFVTDSAQVAFLLAEGQQRSHVPEDLRHLTDVIGPRLTGTAAMRRANEWTAAKMREYGMDSVALEPWPFGIGWQRGPMTVRLLAPHERYLEGVSWAWAPGTNGPRAGDVTYMDATTRAEFTRRFAGKLRGAWVMRGVAYPRVNPDAYTPADSVRVDSLRRALRRQRTADERSFLGEADSLLQLEGVAGEIIDGGKEFGLFTMSGSPDDVARFPKFVVANETFAEFHRSLAAGERVRIEANISNSFGRDTLVQWNTVGEIRGAELPDEVVILGAHLDSWDVGTGATDNGTGSIAVLEAARLLGALKATGARPKRTIRFVLFTGEEQGLYGSQYYVMRHLKEMPRVQSVIILDNGSGRITGMALQGFDDLHDLWFAMLRQVSPLGPFTVRTGNKGGTDHLPFLAAAVPAFNYDQLSRGYDHTHHSQADVFDHTVPNDVKQAATVMAVNALQLANLDRLLPRKK